MSGQAPRQPRPCVRYIEVWRIGANRFAAHLVDGVRNLTFRSAAQMSAADAIDDAKQRAGCWPSYGLPTFYDL